MRTYGQYCPIARAAEILGDRWTVLIVREMSFGVGRFNELQRCLPGISRSVLAQRLRHLQRVGLIESDNGEYVLTAAGHDLKDVMRSLGHWAARWAFGEPDPRELDTDLLMRWISRHLNHDALPGHRVIVRFDFTDRRARRYWLVLLPEEQSVCLHEPGFETDIVLTSDPATLYSVYVGRCTLTSAIRDGLIQVTGPTKLVRAMPNWFSWSDFAPTVREATLASAG